jgi:hypothetical protein
VDVQGRRKPLTRLDPQEVDRMILPRTYFDNVRYF